MKPKCRGLHLGRVLKRAFYGPRVRVVDVPGIRRMGSTYGGWTFVDRMALKGASIVSCGLGEDASFDVEFASAYNAQVLIVDPTPRAVQHFNDLVARVGQPAQVDYSLNGKQPVAAYDQVRLESGQLRLLEVALSDRRGLVRFYAPKDSDDVSHSIVNFQNAYSTQTPFIEVEAIDVESLMKLLNGINPALMKFDIEGAEVLVVPQLIALGVRPEQLLIEYDELNRPSRRSRNNFLHVHQLLLASGYEPVHWDHRSCVSYLLVRRA